MALLIALEGIDGSGKGTQSARLVEHLRQLGQKVELLSFPRYEHTRFGAAIGEFLNGKFGQLDEVHPQLASLLFAGDRFESKDVILDAAERNDVVVFDRYVASNIAHQAAKLAEPERSQLMQWIDSIEHEVYGLPRPDLTILLDLPATAAQLLIAEKAARSYTDRAADLQEADGSYLERVRQVYLSLAVETDHWQVVDCLSCDEVRSIEDIANQLQTIVKDTLASTRS
ncbi:MAG: dTMP kinase [Planctomycetaceae bacterium]